MTPDSAISTGSALHSALLMNADAAEHGQPVRLAVLAMVGTTVYDGGLMDRALSRTLVEQGVPAGSVRFEGMLRYARERSGISRMTVFTELFDDPLAAASANKRFGPSPGRRKRSAGSGTPASRSAWPPASGDTPRTWCWSRSAGWGWPTSACALLMPAGAGRSRIWS